MVWIVFVLPMGRVPHGFRKSPTKLTVLFMNVGETDTRLKGAVEISSKLVIKSTFISCAVKPAPSGAGYKARF
jgi:tetrahydromethanopterin S-methyltransferase subunit H